MADDERCICVADGLRCPAKRRRGDLYCRPCRKHGHAPDLDANDHP